MTKDNRMTPEQFVLYWDSLDAEERLVLARKVLGAQEKASECFLMDHDGYRRQLDELRHQVDELRAENARLGAVRVEVVDTAGEKTCRVWLRFDGVERLMFDGVARLGVR